MTSKKTLKTKNSPQKSKHAPTKHENHAKKGVVVPKVNVVPNPKPAKRPQSLERLDRFFSPKIVAIIGASREEHKIGNVIVSNFVRSFRGKVIPINPHAKELYGIPAHASIKEVKELIDLAVICVPADQAIVALRECGQKKIPNVIMITSGFAEIGNEKRQKELNSILQTYSQMRVMGPNCLGVLDTKSGVDTVFLPADRLGRPREGAISFISQSGALGSALLDWDAAKGYGINKFISYGNATQLTESDYLQYLAWDHSTKIIMMYVEGVKNGKRFMEVLKETTARKPVVILKGGQTSAGENAVKSHTGAIAGSAEVFEAMVKQCGATFVTSMEELFDVARVLQTEPELKGNRVQIITNGGGYGILTADAFQKAGFTMATMEQSRVAEIAKVCPPYASLKNPLDLTGDADNARYQVALTQALADQNVDAIMLILLFQVPRLTETITDDVIAILKNRTKPVLVLSVGGQYSETKRQELESAGISTFQEPLAAERALKALMKKA